MIKLPRAHSKKSLLRISMLNKRNSLSKLEIFGKSRAIQEQVIHSHQFKHAEVVGAYFPIGSEVNTQQIIKVQLENDKTVALPRIDNDEIIFHKISGKYFQERLLIEGRMGIKEPRSSCIPASDLDLVIVPAIAFDKNGSRLGYGRGYYDRFIAGKKNRIFTIGLGFDFQLIEDEIPTSSSDEKINMIVTEQRVLDLSSGI
jgi:5-formyltetrahydrofolate cyclo-ligase